jgi:hypothetical protein
VDPARAVRGEASGGDEAVDMGMMKQVLTPAMEDRKEADLSSEVLGIGGDLEKGFRTGTEQEVVEDLFVH